MRISDWSSDVCSSDLFLFVSVTAGDRLCHAARGMALENFALCAAKSGLDCLDLVQDVDAVTIVLDHLGYTTHLSFDPAKTIDDAEIGRASCREECVSTCRSRWSPYHLKKHVARVLRTEILYNSYKINMTY